ncbi:aminopeptidase P family N-terminal domain-containing protein [Vibrio splendidus]
MLIIVTNYDPHTSEYSADHWLAREWISGFTGSAGTIVVTLHGGGLWTDGRYYIQAEEQLQGSGLDLFKVKLAETPTIPQWLAAPLPNQARVGVDGRSINQEFYLELKDAFSAKGIDVILEHDLISSIWHDRPARPSAKEFVHDLKYAGLNTDKKYSSYVIIYQNNKPRHYSSQRLCCVEIKPTRFGCFLVNTTSFRHT